MSTKRTIVLTLVVASLLGLVLAGRWLLGGGVQPLRRPPRPRLRGRPPADGAALLHEFRRPAPEEARRAVSAGTTLRHELLLGQARHRRRPLSRESPESRSHDHVRVSGLRR